MALRQYSPDTLFGDLGNDTLYGDWSIGPNYAPNVNADTTGGNDALFGGPGDDRLYGGGGADILWGGADSDWLEGQNGGDTLYGGTGIDMLVLDVSPAYTGADNFNGFFGNVSYHDAQDDHATDILLVQGTVGDDTIHVSQIAAANSTDDGQLLFNYNHRAIVGRWRDALGNLLVQQVRIEALSGNDDIEFVSANMVQAENASAVVTGLGINVAPVDVSPLSARSNDWAGVIDGGPGNDILRGANGFKRPGVRISVRTSSRLFCMGAILSCCGGKYK